MNQGANHGKIGRRALQEEGAVVQRPWGSDKPAWLKNRKLQQSKQV